MAKQFFKSGVVFAVGFGALASVANAGGFSRGEADTDILFEDGTYVARGGVIYVSPHRTFSTINGAASDDGRYTNDYWIPSIAAKFQMSENLGCAFTYTQPFGADADYGPDAQAASPSGVSHKDFITNEYATTCDVSAQAGPGRVHFLGGVFLQDFSYTANSAVGNLKLEDHAAFGYRLGVAYDIPEYAMRAQLMYRSKVKHDADDGSFEWLAFPLGTQDAFGSGTLPQSLKLSLQTGVAPGWLVYGSVKWTDWSVLQTLDYSIGNPLVPGGYMPQQDVYNWKDGWTLQAGVAHKFDEKFAGTLNLTWDSGVATGADIYSDTWTVAAGVSVKAGPGELRFGGAVSYLTEGSQSTADDATYNASADGDWAYAISGSYRITF